MHIVIAPDRRIGLYYKIIIKTEIKVGYNLSKRLAAKPPHFGVLAGAQKFKYV
jgi:hypothetical protein